MIEFADKHKTEYLGEKMTASSSVKEVANAMIHALPISDRAKAKWKIYRLVDRILLSAKDAERAEKNPEFKEKVIERKKQKFPGKYTEIENSAINLIGNNKELVFDMVFSYFAYGYTPNEFLCYNFQNKSLAERRMFLSDRDSVRYAYRLNPWDDMDLFMDKTKTYRRFKKYYGRNLFVFNKDTSYETFKKFVFQKRKIVKKNPMESCGRSVELLEIEDTDASYQKIYSRLREELGSVNSLVLEEVVSQHTEMAKYNASSVNTIRCITLKNKEGEIVVPICFMKVGRNGSFVDNGGAGGLLVGIDEKTGQLNSDAIDETGKKYKYHPDSGICFMGEVLPEWKKMISICKKMASELETIKWVGWDMAYTNKGWVVIEGNGATEIIGPQSTSGRGVREKMEQLISGTNLII